MPPEAVAVCDALLTTPLFIPSSSFSTCSSTPLTQARIYLEEVAPETGGYTHVHLHVVTVALAATPSITQSTFRELNEPNNCIEHLSALVVPEISFATLPRLFTLS